jgi:hypothetical protein
MARKPLTIDQVLTLLQNTVPGITAHIDGLTSTQLHARPVPDQWSINDILAHLRSCADVWGDCIVKILNEDHPTLRAVNPRTWITKTDYPEQEFQRSFQAFTTQRIGLLGVLESLPHENWSRAATVTGAGKPLERTVFFYAAWLATHERTHLKQIGRTAQAIRMQ